MPLKNGGDGLVMRQMELVGVRVEVATDNPIVLLRETDGDRRYLPIWIGRNEATAIAFAQQDIVPPVPLTHDLMRDMLEALGAGLTSANITDLQDGIFHCYLVFSNSSEVRARPSDSIALAVRTGAPVYVCEEILDEAAVSADVVEAGLADPGTDEHQDPEQEAGNA